MSGSRERFFAAVKHQRPDRVPMDLWVRPEVMRELSRHLGVEQVADVLGIDFANVDLPDRFAGFDRKAADPRGGDWPGAGGRYIWHDERTFEDPWGIVRRVGSNGKLVEWISGPFAETTDLASYIFPCTDHLAEPSEITAQIASLKAADKVVCTEVAMPFKRAWHMRGLENLLCDMLLDRDFVAALYDRIYAFETERAVRAVTAGADVIQVIGDIAMEDRLLFKPEIFQELDVPRLREMIRKTREAKPDVLMFYHSDGDMTEAMDDLIDVGFDIINPIQPECMDPYEVKQRWGNRITIWGTISVRTTLPRGTPDSIRALVQERIRKCGHNGGFVLAPANVISYDTPVENIVAMYEAGREFRW